jgi:hypothetical protein
MSLDALVINDGYEKSPSPSVSLHSFHFVHLLRSTTMEEEKEKERADQFKQIISSFSWDRCID